MKLLRVIPRLLSGCLVVLLCSLSAFVNADESAEIAKAITAGIQAGRPDLRVASVKPSEIPGMYAVQIQNGPMLYATADAKHFVLGDLFEVTPGGFINLAEKRREVERAEIMAGIKADDMIIFGPKDQPAKAAIMVFTDVDCYYCQKLHREIPDLNRMGIEVRYLAYPRAGIGSESYKKIASAWCAEDKQTAMTRLKRLEKIVMNVCPGNPVEDQFELGQKVGVNGTPALVTTEGRLMPGYMPALQLAAALGVPVERNLAMELQRKMAAERKR